MSNKNYVICASFVKGYAYDSAIFFRPESKGYTCCLEKAGKYTKEEAELECQHPSGLVYFHVDELKSYIETHAVKISGLIHKKLKAKGNAE